jgi:hypothetical protein
MGSLTVIDHTEQRWQYRYRKHGRENGASTYSKEIVAEHVPIWAESLSPFDATISTCPRMLNMDHLQGDLAVQYLHTYPYKEGLHNINLIDKHLKQAFDRRIYVTAYKSLAAQGILAGYEVWHVPMAIDTSRVNPMKPLPQEHRGERAAVYYGNLLGSKVDPFKKLKDEFQENGWSLVRVNGPQRDCWHELLKFNYGVGVGRCALEMGHLGLRVMIHGAGFGGIVTNEFERKMQLDTNCNGRITTFDREVKACLAAWDLAIPFTNDVHDVLSILDTYLQTI